MIDPSKLIDRSWYWVESNDSDSPGCYWWNADRQAFYHSDCEYIYPGQLTSPPRGPITRNALPIVGDDRIATAEFIASLPGAEREGKESIFRVGSVTIDCMWSDGRINITDHAPAIMTKSQVRMLLAVCGGVDA